jgi:hypothetical protein
MVRLASRPDSHGRIEEPEDAHCVSRFLGTVRPPDRLIAHGGWELDDAQARRAGRLTASAWSTWDRVVPAASILGPDGDEDIYEDPTALEE